MILGQGWVQCAGSLRQHRVRHAERQEALHAVTLERHVAATSRPGKEENQHTQVLQGTPTGQNSHPTSNYPSLHR